MQRLIWAPGVNDAEAEISLPSYAPSIDTVVSAQMMRNVSLQVDASAVAADSQLFVGLLDGAGGAVTGVTVGHAGGADADIEVPGAFKLVAVAPTKVSASKIKLDVATTKADVLILTYAEVGTRIGV
jgi:hypothetical protein